MLLRRFALVVLATVLLSVWTTTAPAWAGPARFTDVPSSFWGARAIDYLAGRGMIRGFPDGLFQPDSLVTRAQCAVLVDAALHLTTQRPSAPAFKDVPPSYWGYAAVETAYAAGVIHGFPSGRFEPDQPVTRQQMAVILAGALHLTQVARDLGAPTSFRDDSTIDNWAAGAVTAAARLGLMRGLPDGRFAPRADASRAQAAQVIYGLVTLPATAVNGLAAGVARRIVVSAPVPALAVGQSETVAAAVYDAQGRLLPVTPAFSATDGTVSAAGVFTAAQPGSAVVTAGLTAGTRALRASVTIRVTPAAPPPPPASALALGAPNPASIVAGGSLSLTVQVLDNNGNQLSADQGRTIALRVTTPSYQVDHYTATDTGGSATFTIEGTEAGSYTVEAQSKGLTPAAGTTFQVEPAAPDHLQLSASPSTLVLPGRPAQITATAVDVYGNPTTAACAATLTANTTSYGTIIPLSHKIAGVTAVGTFVPNSRTGTTTLTLTAPGTPYAPAVLTLSSLAGASALTSGKGMWLTYDDWENIPDSSIIATAQADHITHLYLEVAATATGFYGKPALADLLAKAHAAHIALIAWIYTALDNPAQDAALATRVAGYRTAGGDGADGLAVDMEQNLDPANIASFLAPVRQSLGRDYLLVAVVYPPQSHPGRTYASMYGAVTAFTTVAPMDYWHTTPTVFTPGQAAAYVTQSLQMLQGLTGSLPVDVAGQAYNMFDSGDWSPSGGEETAAITAARAGGAAGYSMYRWGTASPAEWQAFQNFNW